MELRLEGVSKYYIDQGKSVKGVENITTSFQTDGSFVVITGESGAGKSTLIKILTGLEDIDEGEIYFDEEPISALPEKRRAELYASKIAFVFQDYNLVESFTALENLVLALLKRGLNLKAAKKKALKALEEVGLSKQAKMRVSKLSGGERQRVAIARCLASDAEVVIFDEPTGNLDPDTSEQIVELIASSLAGRLVLYVTHEYEFVEHLATRHIIINDGHIETDVELRKPAVGQMEKSPIPEEDKAGKTVSTLYPAYLFAFGRKGRFVATFLTILVTVASLLGVGYASSLALIDTASSTAIGTNYRYSMGSLVKVTSDNQTAKQELPKALSSLSDADYYIDYGDLLFSPAWYLHSPNTYDNTKEGIGYGSSGIEIRQSCYRPTAIANKFHYNGEVPDDYYRISAVFYNSDNLSASAWYKMMTPVTGVYHYGYNFFGKPAVLANFSKLIYDCPNRVHHSFIDDPIRVMLTDVFVTDDESFDDGYAHIYGDRAMIDDCVAHLKTGLTDAIAQKEEVRGKALGIIEDPYDADPYKRIPDEAELYKYFRLYGDDEWKSAPNPSLIDDKGKIYEFNKCGFARTNKQIILPLAMKENLSYYHLKAYGSSLTLDKLTAFYEPVYYEDTSIYSHYGQYYYVDETVLLSYFLNNGGQDAVAFSSYEKADAFTHEVNLNGLLRAYRLPSSHEELTMEKVVKIDFATASFVSRISSFGILAGLLVALGVLLFLIRGILGKFYYRQDNDQLVLSWIGYKRAETVRINLVDFIGMAIVADIIAIPLALVFVPNLQVILFSYPAIFIFTIILSLLAAAFLALPKRNRKRRA